MYMCLCIKVKARENPIVNEKEQKTPNLISSSSHVKLIIMFKRHNLIHVTLTHSNNSNNINIHSCIF